VVRRAEAADADAIGQLLHDFNVEYEDVTPGPEKIAQRVRKLIESGDTVVLLAGDGPDGLALMRFRPSIWIEARECYLGELYVVPDKRGRGIGRELMDEVLEVARREGAGHIELNTSHDDVAARALYEKLGFTNREGRADGPVMYYYEREL
jgi:ribosomal protein S18 acetylase RimI-like enzyme